MCRLEYCGQKNKKYSFEYFLFIRARDGTRTRGPDLGKVVLHQLSHSRMYVLYSVIRIPDIRLRERETGLEPATPTLARSCSTN